MRTINFSLLLCFICQLALADEVTTPLQQYKDTHIEIKNDESWTRLKDAAKLNDSALALTVDGVGNLYAGGRFTSINGVSANHIAKWNGKKWTALDLGLGLGSELDSHVSALVIDGSGNLYAGGVFAKAGKVSVNNIAKWDGEHWSPLSDGLDGEVYALAFSPAGELYAGAVSVLGGFVKKWDGKQWRTVGMASDFSQMQVMQLAVSKSGSILALGSIDFNNEAEGDNGQNIVRWDGKKWRRLQTSSVGTEVQSIAIDSHDNLYAAIDAGVGEAKPFKYVDNQWISLSNRPVDVLFVDEFDNLYVGSQHGTLGSAGTPDAPNGITNNIAAWNRSNWRRPDNFMKESVTAIAKYRNYLYVSGFSPSSSGSEIPDHYITQWQIKNSNNTNGK